MSEDRTGRELTPARRRAAQPPAPPPSRLPLSPSASRPDRRTHTVGPHRGARRTGRAAERQRPQRRLPRGPGHRLFIPVYWFYDLGMPALGVAGPDGGPTRTPVRHRRGAWLRAVPRQLRPLPRPERPGWCRAAAQRPDASCTTPSRRTGAPGTGHLNPDYIAPGARGRRALRLRRRQQRHAGMAPARAARSTTARSRSS